jgi:polyphosphate kinase
VRLEVSAGCSDYLADFPADAVQSAGAGAVPVHGPVNLVRLTAADRPGGRAAAAVPHTAAMYPCAGAGAVSRCLSGCKQGDVLMHQPFESFDGVLAFLREAVE